MRGVTVREQEVPTRTGEGVNGSEGEMSESTLAL